MASQLITIPPKGCKSTFQPLQPQTGNKAVDDFCSRLQQEILRAMAALATCTNQATKVTIDGGSNGGGGGGSTSTFSQVIMPGIDGDDGDDGMTIPGITPKTYFDLELSYGREDGTGTLAAFGTGGEGTPNFYLRPNTDLTVLTVGTSSPGEVWEYEVTRELSGDLTLDLCVYQCLITPQPSTTATLSVSITKNTVDILTIPDISGVAYSIGGTRFTRTLSGISYLPGDKMGIHVNTVNFSSGTLNMTAHASCEEKAIAAGSITGPTGPRGLSGISIPGSDGDDGEDGFGFPGNRGLKGDKGDAGDPGADAGGFVINFSFGMNPNSTADIFPIGTESDPQFYFNQTAWGDIYTAYAFGFGGGNIIVTNAAGQQVIEFPVLGGSWTKADLFTRWYEALPNNIASVGNLYVTKNSGAITPTLTTLNILMPSGLSPGLGPTDVNASSATVSFGVGDFIGLYFLGNTSFRSNLPTQSRYRFTATIRLYN